MEPIVLEKYTELKTYRLLSDETERLGRRLDAARGSLDYADTDWSLHYWSTVLDQLEMQWKRIIALHDGDARDSGLPKWTVDYNFYELDDGIGQGFFDRLFEKFKGSPSLQESWDRVREQRLARAQ